MKHFLPAFRILTFLTLVTGFAYPLLITGIASLFFSQSANGDLVQKDQNLVGSMLISQKFESPQYFSPRPSAIGYNPLPSGGSQRSQNSIDLKKVYDERLKALQTLNPEQNEKPPQDLLFASGSGLDPHISPESALYQMKRVAHARNINLDEMTKIVKGMTHDRQFGIFGEPTINVLELNLALDRTQGK